MAENGFETPGNVSLVIIEKAINHPKTWILTHSEYNLTPSENHTLQTSLNRLLQGVPLPHILGEWEFYGRKFIVTPDVLIPRPETELLIEQALKTASDLHHSRIVDVGCGSGIIAITLAAALPRSRVIGVDLSRPALNVALRNADRHDVVIDFVQANLLEPVVGRFDLICANLPYIPTDMLSELNVARWEPRLALDGGPDGLVLIRNLLSQAQTQLASHGVILLEIEASLGEEALQAAGDAFPAADIHLFQDLSGKDRLVRIQIH